MPRHDFQIRSFNFGSASLTGEVTGYHSRVAGTDWLHVQIIGLPEEPIIKINDADQYRTETADAQ